MWGRLGPGGPTLATNVPRPIMRESQNSSTSGAVGILGLGNTRPAVGSRDTEKKYKPGPTCDRLVRKTEEGQENLSHNGTPSR